MSFNTNKCKVMHVGRTNQKFTYVMDGHNLDTVDSQKELGVMIIVPIKSCNHYRKANKMLGMITRCSAIAERPRCRMRYSFRQK